MAARTLGVHESIVIDSFDQIVREPPPYMREMLKLIEDNSVHRIAMMHPRRSGKSIIAAAMLGAVEGSEVELHAEEMREHLNMEILKRMNEAMSNTASNMSVTVRPSTVVYDELEDQTTEHQGSNFERYIGNAGATLETRAKVKRVKPNGRVVYEYEQRAVMPNLYSWV